MGAKAEERPGHRLALTGKFRRDCGWRVPEWGSSGMGDSNWFLQPAVVCSSETSDPTGLVTVRTAMVPIDSPRRYIRYAAMAPATIVPQNNALFITAPLQGTCSREACACHFRMQKAAWKRRGGQKCSTQGIRHGSQKPIRAVTLIGPDYAPITSTADAKVNNKGQILPTAAFGTLTEL
jgi:hypothetical protein